MLESRKYAPEVLEAEAAPEQATSSVKHKTLKELTLALLKEVESLKGNEAADGRLSVNFAEEVRRFETDLIRWALMHTGGHQRRAARMLNIKVTTLNAKIKRYGIRPNAVSVSNVVDFYPDSRQQ
ncbi:MAG TPA: helix-turn-helix domain-containing protein [Pyrinomonadaceae bacterium]|nr:helix-turn-helix domain-containing protein [Pyrinomonadaceae bacterium]